MKQYLDLMQHILDNGAPKNDRTETGTLSVFGHQMRFDLGGGFPLVTTKKIHLKSVIHELLWMIKGNTNIKYLNDNGVTIWDQWADDNRDLGPIYGRQWRSWPGYFESNDQLASVIEQIRKDPDSRRHIVSTWNVADLPLMRLPPCHILFQFYVANGRLSCQLYQRSADVFLGVPFNIASYSLLTLMIAHIVGLQPGEFIWTGGDCHLYVNHIRQVEEQLNRTPKRMPDMLLNCERDSIDDFVYDDFELLGYDPWPAIKAPVAV